MRHEINQMFNQFLIVLTVARRVFRQIKRKPKSMFFVPRISIFSLRFTNIWSIQMTFTIHYQHRHTLPSKRKKNTNKKPQNTHKNTLAHTHKIPIYIYKTRITCVNDKWNENVCCCQWNFCLFCVILSAFC